MSRDKNPNLVILETATRLLGPLVNDVVFLGGCATGLLITDAGAPPIRATQDVDVIAEIGSLSEYYRLSERLREQGFQEDHSSTVICRWTAQGILLDVMPTNPEVLGFGNEWYQPALEAAEWRDLSSGQRIRMVSAPYFLATKLSAFADRGQGDYMASHDLEDMVAVLDGRPEIVTEVAQAPEKLRRHLAEQFRGFLGNARFTDALPGHLPRDESSPSRAQVVMDRMAEIATLR
jgi:hypothetical protein